MFLGKGTLFHGVNWLVDYLAKNAPTTRTHYVLTVDKNFLHVFSPAEP